MCELLALSFNKPVNASLSFRGFRNRGFHNYHGWGYAYYTDKSADLYKEPIDMSESETAKQLIKNKRIISKIFIAHVRLCSVGNISEENTHPFTRELFSKQYVFAHNGTLKNYHKLELNDFKPEGETDSEHIFCYILDQIKERNIKNWNEDSFMWLEKLLYEINGYGDMNIIMSEGEYLFCYFDKNGYNGLSYVKRETPFSYVRLLDEDYEINLAEEKSPLQSGYIIASHPLTDESWLKFEPGKLKVFKGGEIVYS
ncbi:MAG: class II glutamine amidotransferase [Ignavibacterium sp.]